MDKILVTGHPRSGTGYMAHLLQSLGLDVGHEYVRNNGVSSWLFAVQSDWVPMQNNLGRNNYQFDKIILVVRDPLKVVASTLYTEDKSQKSIFWRSKHVDIRGQNPVESAVKSVINWNQYIQNNNTLDLILKVEEAERLLPLFLNRNLVSTPPSKDYNSRPHQDLTFRDVYENCSKLVYGRFIEHCEKFNYDWRNFNV